MVVFHTSDNSSPKGSSGSPIYFDSDSPILLNKKTKSQSSLSCTISTRGHSGGIRNSHLYTPEMKVKPYTWWLFDTHGRLIKQRNKLILI
ncbi:hypothetical protein Leryth_010179 [Lithospermum erythrorhizon]|nr:hypothetical protein Leryth_010179 [Lithospermum erythrorhizon]